MKPRLPSGATLWIGLWVASLGCALSSGAAAHAAEAANSAAATKSEVVRSIELPHLEPDLPMAAGRNEYMMVCVSCHSARYVMMQPRFPQKQWEETVDKMAKTYGAQMDAEQRAAIVGYLVATRGPDAAASPSVSHDEDFELAAQVSAYPETAPALEWPGRSGQLAAELKRGQSLFLQNCAGCHGETGRGDGIVAAALLRKPKDLASTRFALPLLSQVLWNGKRGTAMPSWRGLASTDRAALAAYVQGLHRAATPGQKSESAMRRGSEIFQQNCAPCHGENGDGQGTAAATLLPKPANFRLKQPDSDHLLQVVSDGIPGTAMPAWKDLIPEADRKALAEYVRSLFEGETEAGR